MGVSLNLSFCIPQCLCSFALVYLLVCYSLILYATVYMAVTWTGLLPGLLPQLNNVVGCVYSHCYWYTEPLGLRVSLRIPQLLVATGSY